MNILNYQHFLKSKDNKFNLTIKDLFEEVNESKAEDDTLYIFDFDDTLFLSKRFEEHVIEYLKEDVTIKSLIRSSIKKIGVDLSDLKWENGKVFVNDPNSEIDIKSNWIRKGKRVYLVPPDKFYFTDMSFPLKTTKLAIFYNKVKNKAILTGRHNDVKSKVKSTLEKFNLDIPNHDIYCYPGKSQTDDRIAEWKAKKIVEIIKESGFENVCFYDDNSKWVNKANSTVKKELPNIKWTSIKYKHKDG